MYKHTKHVLLYYVQTVDLFSNETLGVFVLSLEDYLKDFYSGHRALLGLYESLQAIINEEILDQKGNTV